MKCVALCLLALAACGDNDSPEGNPGRLWIAPDMKETKLHLVGEEPDPF